MCTYAHRNNTFRRKTSRPGRCTHRHARPSPSVVRKSRRPPACCSAPPASCPPPPAAPTTAALSCQATAKGHRHPCARRRGSTRGSPSACAGSEAAVRERARRVRTCSTYHQHDWYISLASNLLTIEPGGSESRPSAAIAAPVSGWTFPRSQPASRSASRCVSARHCSEKGVRLAQKIQVGHTRFCENTAIKR